MTEMATIKVIITGEATLEEDLDNPQWSHPALAFCSQMLLNLAQQTARPISSEAVFGWTRRNILCLILCPSQYAHSGDVL